MARSEAAARTLGPSAIGSPGPSPSSSLAPAPGGDPRHRALTAPLSGEQSLAFMRLLQLASPTLPVGAYSYSQGLEWAVASGVVRDAASTGEWIGDHLTLAIRGLEAPVWWRLYGAWARGDALALGRWNECFLASRETLESRLETLQMGQALARLLAALPREDFALALVDRLQALEEASFPAVFSAAAWAWGIDGQLGLHAYLWSWLENQVLAAMKTVPLGQVAGQSLLLALAARIPAVVAWALACPDEALGNFAPGLAIAGACHETQYSRLFRS